MPHLHLRGRPHSEVQRNSTVCGVLHPKHRVTVSHTRRLKALHTTPAHTPDQAFQTACWRKTHHFGRLVVSSSQTLLQAKWHLFPQWQTWNALLEVHGDVVAPLFCYMQHNNCLMVPQLPTTNRRQVHNLLLWICDWDIGLPHKHKLVSCTRVFCRYK